METRDNIIRKTFNKKGFTLVELLAVIVILAVIMVLAIPSVLTVLGAARQKTFVEYTTKVYNASNQKYTTDQLIGSGQPSCVIYNVVNDLDLSNVGSYKGFVAVSKENGNAKYYITLYDEIYMLVAYNYSDRINSKFVKSEIDDSLLDYNEDDKDTLLTVEYLSSVANKDCAYIAVNADGSLETIMVNADDAVRKDISTLKTGEEVNYLWKKLANDAAESWQTEDSSIKNIVKVDTPPLEETKTVVISDGNDKQEETISWYQDGTIYVYSKANRIYANNDSSYLFIFLHELAEIDLSLFDFSNTELFSFLLYGDDKLTSVDLTKLNISKASSLDGLVADCSNLTNIIGYENLNVSKVQYLDGFFAYLPKITSLDLSKWDVSNAVSLNSLFAECTNLTSVNISNWNTSKVTNFSFLFYKCEKITNIDVSNWNTSSAIHMVSVFDGCIKLTSVDVSRWKTGNVTYMMRVFAGCQNLTSLDVSRWETSNVLTMESLFYDCQNLTSLDLSKWDVSKVISFKNTFYNCVRITYLNVSGWNTSSAQTMSYMFHNCTSLENLDVSSFNTSNVITLDHMFNTDDKAPFPTRYGKLKSLDLSGWDVSKVGHLSWFLEDQRFITTLDLSNWDTSNCKSFNHMFSGMLNLKTVYASEKFVVNPDAEYIDQMFPGCNVLVGGNGTKYASNHVGYQYAVIDTPSKPGYFTKKE